VTETMSSKGKYWEQHKIVEIYIKYKTRRTLNYYHLHNWLVEKWAYCNQTDHFWHFCNKIMANHTKKQGHNGKDFLKQKYKQNNFHSV